MRRHGLPGAGMRPPAMYTLAEIVESGGLMAFSLDLKTAAEQSVLGHTDEAIK